jgi:enterochelin esterase-like enzyme
MTRGVRYVSLVLVLVAGAIAAVASLSGSSQAASARAASPRVVSPIVKHTGRAPTGYAVTFTFHDPAANSVKIRGEWYFADPAKLAAPESTQTNTVATPGLLPQQWSPGDFPIAYPNSTAANWPVQAMKRSGRGNWTITVPLPSGTFTYGFYVNCDDPTLATCTEISDPANRPWNQKSGVTHGSIEPTSQVYVPSDPAFGTVDYSWQAPNPRHGQLRDVTYPSPASTSPAGSSYLAVYTPPGYKPHRATPYPTLYLSAPGSELDWSTQGDLANIMDNLIDTGQIAPMIVVTPAVSSLPTSAGNEVYDNNLINAVLPYVQSHYNVSTDPSQRAYAGIGYSGNIANSLLFDHTGEFGYIGAMSFGVPGQNGNFDVPPASAITAQQAAALNKTGIFVGGGRFDPNHYSHAAEIATLAQAGVAVTPDFIVAGHEWYTWRILLKDFLTRVAFYPPVTS